MRPWCQIEMWVHKSFRYRTLPDRSTIQNRVDQSIHYNDVILGAMVSQITSLTIVYSTVYLGADQRKHQSSASLAFVLGIHRWPVNSPHKRPVTRKMFPFDDVIICCWHVVLGCRRIPLAFSRFQWNGWYSSNMLRMYTERPWPVAINSSQSEGNSQHLSYMWRFPMHYID